MDDSEETTRSALKIVLILSIILVTMDIMEVYYTFINLDKAISVLELNIFQHCYKYHILSQMVFTIFATFSGLSALIMSLGLLYNYEFFVNKALECFMYLNYMIFGPFLLAACMLGYLNYSDVLYNCERGNLYRKYLNLSSLIALCTCFLISIVITFAYSILHSMSLMINSINGRGNSLIRKLFWKVVFSRRNIEIQMELQELRD